MVTIYLPDGNGEENCVITNLNISRDNKVSNGYRVSITAKKVQTALSTITDVAVSAELAPKNETTATPTDKNLKDTSAVNFNPSP